MKVTAVSLILPMEASPFIACPRSSAATETFNAEPEAIARQISRSRAPSRRASVRVPLPEPLAGTMGSLITRQGFSSIAASLGLSSMKNPRDVTSPHCA